MCPVELADFRNQTPDESRLFHIRTLLHIAFRTLLIAGLVSCIYFAVRQGVSTSYARQHSVTGWHNALRWDPGNPQFPDDVATFTRIYADANSRDVVLGHYKAATNKSPENAYYWADLGGAYEWAGQSTNATLAFERAQQLFPNSTAINWRAANFDLRQNQRQDALLALRKVFTGGGVPHDEVFRLAANAGDANAILRQLLPITTAAYLEYLNYAIRNDDIPAAEQTWDRMLKLPLQFAPRDVFPYLDALIHDQKLTEARQAWTIMSVRFPSEIHVDANSSNLIENQSFEHEVLNGGFDWRVFSIKGTQVGVDQDIRLEGSRSLRIEFDGTENPYYCHVFQYVPVKAGTRYRFSGYLRTRGITTESGPRFEIYDAYNIKKLFLFSEGQVGTSEWSRHEIAFKTSPETHLLVVRIGRPPSQKIANQIGGTVWIDEVSLEQQQ